MSAPALHCILLSRTFQLTPEWLSALKVSSRAIPGGCCMCGEPPLRDFCPHGAFSYSGRTRYMVSISFHLQVAVPIGPRRGPSPCRSGFFCTSERPGFDFRGACMRLLCSPNFQSSTRTMLWILDPPTTLRKNENIDPSWHLHCFL